jgi:putative tryptophan/tyrosine transport system substrate-binding protein
MNRREFIAALGGAAAAWPVAVRAQQPARMRRIGVLMSTTADDPETQLRLAAFLQGLQGFGWTVGQNVQIDTRWASGDVARPRSYAAELLTLSPDIMVAGGRAATVVPQVRQAGSDIPIVFVQGVDPVGTGYVAPGMTHAAVLRELGGAGIGQWAVLQAAASSPPVELSPVNAGEPAEIERAVAAFAREPNGGLIVVVSSWATVHRDLIVALAAKHRLPAIYPYRYFVTGGGLMSYGPDLIDQ